MEYKFTRDGKIILESKEKLKERTGKSPDLADSAVLTFARPVVRQQDLQYAAGEEEEYDPLAGL